MQNKRLDNQVVVVTGGSSDLGKAIAIQAAKQGAIVVVLARRLEVLNEVKQTCENLSNKPAYAFELDVSNPTQIDKVVSQIKETVSTPDVLVNAAGFGSFDLAFETPMPLVEKMFRVNVLGLMYLSRAFGQEMVVAKKGHIINIASMAGKIATPKSAIYSATKFAVMGYSNGLRLELKPLGIQVTTVNPGPIDTAFFELADKSGEYLKSVDWLVLDPDKLAAKIVASFGTSKREINVPLLMEIGSKCYNLFPHVGDFLTNTVFNRK